MSAPADMSIVLRSLFAIADWQRDIPWQPFRPGIDIHRLYGGGSAGASAALLRFAPRAEVAWHEHVGHEHILVLSGAQTDHNGRAEAGTLVVNRPGTAHSVVSEHGCIVLAIYEQPVRFCARPANA